MMIVLIEKFLVLLFINNFPFYSVDDVDFSKNPLSEFEMSNGESVSFLNYYKTQYGKEILDLKQPLLISRFIDILISQKCIENSLLIL